MANNLDKFGVEPESQFIEVLVKDINTNVDGIAGLDIREFDAKVSDGDAAVVVNEALAAQGENVAQAQEWPRDAPGAE